MSRFPWSRTLAGFAPAAIYLCALSAQQPATHALEDWNVTVGKSIVVDSPIPIGRISITDGAMAEAVGIGPREILINGKAPGETSVILWQNDGSRLIYNLNVRVSPARVDAVRQQIALEFPGDDINIVFDNNAVFVRGTVKDVVSATRVAAIAATLGKVVNLLRVDIPPAEAQILVKVRFCDVDRSASRSLSVDLASSAFNQTTALGPDQPISTDGKTFSLSDAVNIFLFRKDLNLGAAIQALAAQSLLEMLAEPTVPAINGKMASFVAGGEFPFPVVQPGATGSTITISWREYGIRLNFTPLITPRGSIRLQVAPEVSSLDYTHSVSVGGTTIPALSTRKVQTEIELESGQSFVIAGLLDNQITDSLSKVPGIGDIPILGKLFQSKTTARNNSELLVIVTPEIVRPIPAGQTVPDLNYPKAFMPDNTTIPLHHPDSSITGEVPAPPAQTIPVELLLQQQKQTDSPAAIPAANPSTGSPSAQGAASAQPASAPPPAANDGGIQK
jgi:pilus assembly protein CpaC